MPGESKTSPRRLAAVEKGRQALELRIAGASFDQIATQVGYASKAGAYMAVKAALDRVPAPEVAEYRRLNLERLNRLRLHNQAGIVSGRKDAMNLEIDIQEREAKYLGLDAPIKAVFTGKDDGPIQIAAVTLEQKLQRIADAGPTAEEKEIQPRA